MKGKDWVDKLFPKLPKETKGRIRIWCGMPGNFSRADDRVDPETMAPYVERFQADIRLAKEKADLVLFYPHVGGQFNPKPGAISEYVMEKALEAAPDAILASHAHMVQKAVIRQGVPCAYSLGNFNMDPHSSLMIPELLPQYGLAVHLYVEDKKIVKTTFSILKAVKDPKNGQICAWPVDELYASLGARGQAALEKDVRKMYEMVNETPLEGEAIRREYLLINEA